MTRISNVIFNVVSLLSLLFGVATAALWVRSYHHVETFGREGVERADHWQSGGFAFSRVGAVGCEWWLRHRQFHILPSVQWGYDTWPVNTGLLNSQKSWLVGGNCVEGCAGKIVQYRVLECDVMWRHKIGG